MMTDFGSSKIENNEYKSLNQLKITSSRKFQMKNKLAPKDEQII